MSYLVLARKARPQTFEEVVGQKPVIRTLQNGLRQDRVPHALIFSGVRGVGKTTLARIMAKALNCEQGPTATPCNECRSCREITTGASVDLHEIDGASNRGIQEIRELKEKIRYLPSGSRYKIIIIDEVHMLTTEAFNALLKTLEEPPDHVFFMFATTEVHKVPVTILSRCQRYELKRVSHRELTAHFNKLAVQEGVEVEAAAIDIIVRESEGSVRDGLSLLDQVFSYGGDSVTAKDVIDVLGLVDRQVIKSLAAALLAGDLGKSLDLLDEIYSFGMDLKRFINDLLGWFRSLVVYRVSKNPEKLLDLPEDDLADLHKTAEEYSIGSLFTFFHLLLESLEKITYSSRPRLALEMAMIRAIQARDIVPVSDILAKLDTMIGDQGDSPPDVSGSNVTAGKMSTLKQAVAPVKVPEEEIKPVVRQSAVADERHNSQQLDTQKEETAPKSKPLEDAPQVKLPPAEKKENRTKSSGVSAAVETPQQEIRKNVRQHWQEFISYVKDRKPWMAHTLQQSAKVKLQDTILIIKYDDGAVCKLFREKVNLTMLTEFALDFFQENLQIKFQVPDSKESEVDADNGISPQQERQALANDPLVMTAVEIFNGQVGDVRVGPRFRKKLNKEKQQPRKE